MAEYKIIDVLQGVRHQEPSLQSLQRFSHLQRSRYQRNLSSGKLDQNSHGSWISGLRLLRNLVYKVDLLLLDQRHPEE